MLERCVWRSRHSGLGYGALACDVVMTLSEDYICTGTTYAHEACNGSAGCTAASHSALFRFGVWLCSPALALPWVRLEASSGGVLLRVDTQVS